LHAASNMLGIQKRQGKRSALPQTLELIAIVRAAGTPRGPVLKPLSRLVSLRIALLLQEAIAVLTSAMIWSFVSA
jgi:hypothetical protein